MKLAKKLAIATTSVALSVAAVSAKPASAASIAWTDWTSATPGNPGLAQGTITPAGESPISVTYNGEVNFAQTSGGTNYWNPSTPYISATVPNAPPASDIIALNGGNSTVNTISFSKAVLNPVMAIVSLGEAGVPVQYNFDTPFNILSVGAGYWGNGTLAKLAGNVLEGVEGHGVIQFLGNVSSISWTTPKPEYWHGFTVGVEKSVPEPLTIGGSAIALGFGWWAKRKRTAATTKA
ncbi:MAG: PEP-CTERM sorting domain-containing protein [Aulosira sp. ZfuVER01]|nr:PEP-CTERM sorting domain-containing protein [Aulosira sp. ZfuVER01]MDZ8054345.1 PEP-CTERM sorting domain-containing protein [Aulosira sp. ZfuCHP01]